MTSGNGLGRGRSDVRLGFNDAGACCSESSIIASILCLAVRGLMLICLDPFTGACCGPKGHSTLEALMCFER